MRKQTTVTELAQKYKMKTIVDQIEEIYIDTPPVRIGFLGEFSSGKSTLINALLEKKLLPAMAQPTSKCIIEVIPSSDNTNDEFFAWVDKKKWQKISAYDFSELATGEKPGGPLQVLTTAKGILKEGYIFIDTPGISSLEKSDADITFGCLPLLDGVVICVDINKGSLSQSILSFMEKKEVKPILDHLIIAVNMADTKLTEQSKTNIRETIQNQMHEFCKKNAISLTDINSRIVVLSAKDFLENQDLNSIIPFNEAFQSLILSRHSEQVINRRNKQIRNVAGNLRFALEENLKNLSLNDGEIKAKENVLFHEKQEFARLAEKMRKNMVTLKNNLERELLYEAELAIGPVAAAAGAGSDAVSDALIKHSEKMSATAHRLIETYFKDQLQLPAFSFDCSNIGAKIENIKKGVDFSKTLATAILLAVIIPGGGIAGNAVQGSQGAAMRIVGKKAAITAGAQVAKRSILSKSFLFLGTMIKDINPFEYIGDLVAKNLINSSLPDQLVQIANQSSENIYRVVQIDLENNVLIPLEEKLAISIESLQNCQIERKSALAEIEQQRAEITADCENLAILIEEI